MLLGVAETITGAGLGADGGATRVARTASREGQPSPARVRAETRTYSSSVRRLGIFSDTRKTPKKFRSWLGTVPWFLVEAFSSRESFTPLRL